MFSYVLLVGWRRRTRGGRPSEARGGLLTTAATTTTRTSSRWASGGTVFTSCPRRQVTRPSTRRPTPVFAQRGQYQGLFSTNQARFFEAQAQGHPDPTTPSPRPRRRRGASSLSKRSDVRRGASGPLLFYCGTRPVPMRLGIRGRACLFAQFVSTTTKAAVSGQRRS